MALKCRCGPGTEVYRSAAARLRSWRRNGTKDGVCRYLVLVPYRASGTGSWPRRRRSSTSVPFLPLTFEVMYEHITRGTREHGLLPQVTDTSEPGARPSNGTAAKVKAVLVVSLKLEYYNKLHNMYYTNTTVAGKVVMVYQPSHNQDQHSEAWEHNERALSKIFLLSYYDRLVTTGFSMFGYVAHSLAGL